MSLYKDPSEQAIRCPDKGYQKPLLSCLACRRFPCTAISDGRLAVLKASPFVCLEFNGFISRRKKVILFHMSDGSYKEAPKDFDTEKPAMDKLEGVEEVLVIGKVLVKQVRLVPKPKEERDRIRTALSETEETGNVKVPVVKTRKRKKVA